MKRWGITTLILLLVALGAAAELKTRGTVSDWNGNKFQLDLEDHKQWYFRFIDGSSPARFNCAPTDRQIQEFRQIYARAKQTALSMKPGPQQIVSSINLGRRTGRGSIKVSASNEEGSRKVILVAMQEGFLNVFFISLNGPRANGPEFERLLKLTNP